MKDDTIKREDAIGAINGWLKRNHFPEFGDGILYLVPSADKQQVDGATLISAMALGYSYGIKADRPQGEWKPKNHHTDYCSLCGFEETQWRTIEYKFCPHCGARMKGIDDESI